MSPQGLPSSTSWLYPPASALALIYTGTEAGSQLWHPYVSHSALENGASEPSSPPNSGLFLHLQAQLMVGKLQGKGGSEFEIWGGLDPV